jgi:hypothetical protein
MKRISQDETHKYRKLSHIDFRHNMFQAIAFTLSPTEDGADIVDYYGETWMDPTNGALKPHWVYILVNPSIPGICKIGYTTNNVYARCKEINSSTGVITPWYPVFSFKCGNGRVLEDEIHAYLEALGYRVNSKREGFQISSNDAIKIIEKLGNKYKTN